MFTPPSSGRPSLARKKTVSLPRNEFGGSRFDDARMPRHSQASSQRALSFDAGVTNISAASLQVPHPAARASHQDTYLPPQRASFSSDSAASSAGGMAFSPVVGRGSATYWPGRRAASGTPMSSPGGVPPAGPSEVQDFFEPGDSAPSPFTPPPHRHAPTFDPFDTEREPSAPPVVGAPPISAISEFAAQMLCYLWFAPPSTLQRAASPAAGAPPTPDPSPMMHQGSALTQAQLVPEPEFVKFIESVLSTTQVSTSVVLLALLYVHRLKINNPITPLPTSERRVGIVSLMLANKILDDHTYTAKTWSDVSGLPLECLNKGETEFLEGLQFELHVDVRAFSAWFRLLTGMVQLRHSIESTKTKRNRGGRSQQPRYKAPWGDTPSILEGIVTPLRNAPSMQIQDVPDLASLRRSSEMVISTSNDSYQGRAVLPLPSASRHRARSSSPMAYLIRNRHAGANETSQTRPVSQDGRPREWPTGQQAPTAKRTVSEALMEEELGRSAKRAATSSPHGQTPSPAPRPVYSAQVSPRQYFPPPQHQMLRLPPILAPPSGPDGSRLGAPVQPVPSAGRQAELYFYSLAAGHRNGGQLVRQELPVANQTFRFGAPFHQSAPYVPFPGISATEDGRSHLMPRWSPEDQRRASVQLAHPGSQLAGQRAARSAHSSRLPPVEALHLQPLAHGDAPKPTARPDIVGAAAPLDAQSYGPWPVQWHSSFSNAGLPGVVWSQGMPLHPPPQEGWRPDWGFQS